MAQGLLSFVAVWVGSKGPFWGKLFTKLWGNLVFHNGHLGTGCFDFHEQPFCSVCLETIL